MNHNFSCFNLQRIEFQVICKVEYGQTVGVMGNLGTLGSWTD